MQNKIEFLKWIISLIVEKWAWPLVALISIFILRDHLGKFILSIGSTINLFIKGLNELLKTVSVKILKEGERTETVITTKLERGETFSAQIEDKSQKDRYIRLENLLKENKFDGIEKECKKWRKEDKKNVNPYIFQGRAYLEQKKYNLAQEEFKKAIRINEKNAQIYYYLAKSPFAKGKLKEAKEFLMKAYKLDKEDPKVTAGLAYISYYLENDVNNSLKLIEMAHESYKNREELLPFSENLDVTIHQSMEYYLADRGSKEDFRRAFEIDGYIGGKWEDFANKGVIDKKRQAFILDTRGFLRYRAVEENYRPEEKRQLIQASINFLTEASDLLSSDEDIVKHLVKAIKISNVIK
jgi:tetratricopeptide (TPR) repeat protein